MRRRLPAWAGLAALALAPAAALAVPAGSESRPSPGELSPLPSYVQRVAPAVVRLQVEAAAGSPSTARLGRHRSGSGVVFDARGYAVTVSYLLLDAVRVQARTRDGRQVAGHVAGIDFASGLGVVKLDGVPPWPTADLGGAGDAAAGARTATVGVDDDNDLVVVVGTVHAVRRFSAPWEYMLERALFVAPGSPAFGGSAVVDDRGRVVGIASLRLGAPPHVNLAIPIETFLPVKDELIAAGRVASRRPRPWLGIYAAPAEGGGVTVADVSEVGPAHAAGVARGDRIVGVDGREVRSLEELYERLWRRTAGDVIELRVRRADGEHVITVPSRDRHELFRPGGR